MKKISYIISLSALVSFAANGQVRQPHQLYFMDGIPQIVQMNPALQPKANGYVVFPPVNFNVDIYSDLSPVDLFQPKGDKLYTIFEKEYNFNKLKRSIGRNAAVINLAADIDFLGFGWRTANGYFSFGLSAHIFANPALPSDLFNMFDKLIPEKIDFTPLGFRGMAYMQFRFGYSREITDKLTVGVNVKPILGLAGARLKFDDLVLKTNREEWSLVGNGALFVSGPVKVIKEKNKDGDDIFGIDDSRFNDLIDNPSFRSVTNLINPGIAFDFGASYKIDDRLTVSASLNNLGFINWRNNSSGINFEGGTILDFTGFDIDVSKDDIDIQIEDQLERLINLDDLLADLQGDLIHDGFTTFLPTVFHAGATYQLTRKSTAGFLSRTVFYPGGSVRQSFNLSYYTPVIGNVFLFNTGLTYQVNSTAYLNLGFIFNIAPLQFYILFGSIPLQFSKISIDDRSLSSYLFKDSNIPLPVHTQLLNFRLGFNLTFGRHGFRNNPMLDKGKSSWE